MPFPILMRAISGTPSHVLISLLSVVLCVTGLPAVSQATPLNHLWSKSFGGLTRDVNDEGYSTAVDAAGNVVVAGYFNGTANFGGSDLVANNEQDAFLAKYDANGVHQWSRRLGGNGLFLDDVAYGVAVDASGNVVVTGSFAGTANYGGSDLVSAGGADIFVAKYSSAGVHQWSQRFGGASTDRGKAIAADTAGNILVTCTGSVFLMKLNGAGVTQWSKSLGSNQTATDVATYYTGVLVTGSFTGTMDFGGGNLVSAGGRDVFVATYNAAGVHQWSKRLGGLQNDTGLGIEAGSHCSLACVDYYVVTGSFEGTVNFGAGDMISAGLTDGFVATLSPSSGFVWGSWRFGGALEDQGSAVAFRDNYVTVVGSFKDVVDLGGGPLTSAGGKDMLVARWDLDGGHQWSVGFGNVFDDEGRDIAGSYPDLLTTGYFLGPVDFGGGELDNTSANNVVLARCDGNGTHEWSQGFGGAGPFADDQANALATDAGGNVYMAASVRGTEDFGGGDLAHLGGTDIVLTRYDASGTHQLSARFGGIFNDTPDALAVDGSGNLIVTGRFTGTTNLGGSDLVSQPADFSTTDIFLARYDASGAHLWSQRFGSTSIDNVAGVAVDGSGNIYLTGHFRGTVNFGGADLTSVGTSDIFLAKYDASGVHQWSVQFGSASSETVSGIVVDPAGNSVIAGSFAGTASFGGAAFTSAGGTDVFIARYDASGVHQWSRQAGGTASDTARALGLDGSGDIVVTGGFQGVVDFGLGGLTSAGGTDIFIAKYDAANVPQWSDRFGDTGTDFASEIAVNSSGDIAISGSFGGTVDFGGGNLTASGTGLFTATYDAGGAHQWSQGFAGLGVSNAIAMSESGRVTAAGFFFGGNPDFGGGPLPSVGNQDIFMATFGLTPTPVTGTPVPDRLALSAHPNPFNPQTTIRYAVPSKGRVQLSIYDARGARVATLVNREMPAGVYTVAWDGTNEGRGLVGSGVYFARLQSAGQARSCKLVLLK